jgi:ribosomal protein S13
MACASSPYNVVWYSRGKVKQFMQGSFWGIGDNIANQLYKKLNYILEKKVNEMFEQKFTPLKCIRIGLENEKANVRNSYEQKCCD